MALVYKVRDWTTICNPMPSSHKHLGVAVDRHVISIMDRRRAAGRPSFTASADLRCGSFHIQTFYDRQHVHEHIRTAIGKVTVTGLPPWRSSKTLTCRLCVCVHRLLHHRRIQISPDLKSDHQSLSRRHEQFQEQWVG